jgi:hypothetical protein
MQCAFVQCKLARYGANAWLSVRTAGGSRAPLSGCKLCRAAWLGKGCVALLQCMCAPAFPPSGHHTAHYPRLRYTSRCDAGSCDAVILSLALMGRDYAAFLCEACRLLKQRGYLWVAEVRSRFVPPEASREDFAPFLEGLASLGFRVVKQDLSNRMFVIWVLRKAHAPSEHASGAVWPVLKPCSYKRR